MGRAELSWGKGRRMGRAESSGGVRDQGAGGRRAEGRILPSGARRRPKMLWRGALWRGALGRRALVSRSGEGRSGIAHLAAAQLQRGSVAERYGGGSALRLGAAAAAARRDDRAVCERPRAAVDLDGLLHEMSDLQPADGPDQGRAVEGARLNGEHER